MSDSLSSAATVADTRISARKPLLVFTTDSDAEHALRKGLSDVLPSELDVRRVKLRAAIVQLSRMPSPEALLLDVSGEADPLGMLAELAQIVDPDVRVLVIGDQEDRNFYRQVTRELGAAEFLYKPLAPDAVARVFGTAILRRPQRRSPIGATFVSVTGARGGAGATTIAANLAWHLAHHSRRHTALLDADLQSGSAALMLGVASSSGLRVALEQPLRVDELFVERAAQPVDGEDRLQVLAATEDLGAPIPIGPNAVAVVLGALSRRYNVIVGDVPFRPAALNLDMLDQAHQRVIVMQPTLASVRETLRLITLPLGSGQARRPILVLNRATRPGALSAAQIHEALGVRPDVIVPDLPRPMETAANLGKAAAASVKPLASSIAKLANEIAGTPAPLAPRRWSLLGRGR